ncbi:MAG: type IV secretion system DNA-binding domain-containing protein [Candidatus Parcubacteria bacterium]|nr:type IV secretion system DNA-binding domain-containing protein [Candidatus Parcubacteria bacterium]
MENIFIQLADFQISGPKLLILGGLILFGSIIILIVLFFLAKKIIRQIVRNTGTFKHAILAVQMPKYETVQAGEKTGPKTQQELAEKISIMESFFSNIAGLPQQNGLKYSLLGRNDHISFEIVLKEGLIYFYVVVPEHWKDFIEQQIMAQFPKAYIEEVEDYNIFSPQGTISGAMLKYSKEYIYPIKTYRKLETDSLNALTGALSKLDKGSGAAIQVITRTAHPSWHKWGRKTASIAHQGKKISDAISEAGGGFSFKKAGKMLEGFGLAAAPKKEGEPPKTYQLSALEQEILKGIEEKAAKGGLEVNIRVVVSTDLEQKAQIYLDNILNSFAQFNIYEYGNAFKRYSPSREKLINDFIYREFNEKAKMIMNTEEVTSLFHFPLGHTETPNIVWLQARKSAPPAILPEQGLLVGYNDFRGVYREIRLTDDDRRRHTYIIGQTGTGKSVLQINMAMQDIINGKGICFIDPHGEAIDELLTFVPKERAEDVIIFDPSDTQRPLAINMLEFDRPEQKTFVINEMMNIFDKLYDLKTTGGPIFEQYMRNTMLLMMEDPESGSTLLEVSKVLSDEEFRRYKLSKTKTQIVKDFWEKEAEKAGGEASLANMVPYITSKLTTFIANDIMRPIVAQQKSSFNFSQAMNEQKIILVKLTKGLIGDINANLLGMVIIGKILMAALGRASIPPEQRKDFYLYVDEFQNFLTEGIQIILSEARKYKLSLTVAHQFIGQLVKNNDTKFKDAVFGNVGTKIAFRVGVEDAEIFAKEFAPVFNNYDVMNIPNLNGYIKPLVNGSVVPPFSFHLMPFESRPKANPELAQAIKELSRLKYGRDRNIVEAEITERTKMTVSKEEEEDIFA